MLFLTPVITIYILVMAFIFGAVFASFLGCMGWRMSRGESVMKGRSHCDTCGHTLGVRDLIPIISYVARKGRCAYCKERIPVSSLIGELVLAILFVLTTMRFDISVKLILMLFFVCILYLITLTDLYEQIIPNSCILVAIVVRFIYYFVFESFQWETLLGLVGNGLALSLPMLILVLIMEKILKKEAMGGGDIKLVFVTGMYLGWQQNMLMLLFACMIGIVFAYIQAQKEGESVPIPFGPSLAIGSVISMLVGEQIITWYLSLFY